MTKQKRTKSWWEPVFKKGPENLSESDWEFNQNTGMLNATLSAEKLNVGYREIKGKKFLCCDFIGNFRDRPIKFVECEFEQCDFGKSEWCGAKFRDCTFKETSFSISTFQDCEFRDCNYKYILYSGNTTKIEGTLITNPKEFLLNTKSFVEYLPAGTSAAFQRANLKETQSTFARAILANLIKEGSESTYYEAVMCSTILGSRARHVPSLKRLYAGKRRFDKSHLTWKSFLLAIWVALLFVSGFIERQILRCFGFLNAWGASIVRPMVFGLIACCVFALVYHRNEELPFSAALLKSAEIFLLFGYTNYTNAVMEISTLNLTAFLNALSGILWFAVTIPTIVNKLTRVRG